MDRGARGLNWSSQVMPRLETFTTAGLLELYRDTLRELRDRGVIRTANAPAGDYAEYLA